MTETTTFDVDSAPPDRVGDGLSTDGTEDGAEPRRHRATRRSVDRRRRRIAHGTAVGTYLVLGVLVNWNAWSLGGSVAVSPSEDPKFDAWSLTWIPFSLVHGISPLFTDWVNYPFGVNIAGQVATPLLGFLSGPVNFFFGPAAAYNVLISFSFFFAALTMYILLQRWIRWTPAAFVGGLVFGFSPYMVGQGHGHLNLVFVGLIPLFALLLDEILVRQRYRPVSLGVLLGLLAVGQYLVSTEVLATLAVVSASAIVVLAALNHNTVRTHLRRATVALVTGGGVAFVLLIYPVWYSLHGPQHVIPFDQSATYRADLLGALLPTGNQVIAPLHFQAISDLFAGNLAENGSYLGIPLILVMILTTILCRRSKLAVFSLIMAAITYVYSLGSPLAADNHNTGIKLPAGVFHHLPLIRDLLPARFAMYVSFFAAVLLGLGLDRVHAWSGWSGRTGRGWVPAVSALVIAAAALIPLIPSLPYPVVRADTPSFFTSSAVTRIPKDSVAVVYPISTPQDADSMLWQATARMRFKMPSGYVIVPTPGTDLPQWYERSLTFDVLNSFQGPAPVARSPQLRSQLLTQWHQWQVHSVVVAHIGLNSGAVRAFITWVVGRPPVTTGGVDLWLQVGTSRSG
jgi:hypothetical protein